MIEIKVNNIPHRQRCINNEHPYVGGARDIYDDIKGKSQEQVNSELYNLIVGLPVSDGTDIEAGAAYIDSTDRTVKVKATT